MAGKNSNKVVAVLVAVACIVVVFAAMAEASEPDDYKQCFTECNDKCFQGGKGLGFTHCEVTCDGECSAKEIKAKIDHLIP